MRKKGSKFMVFFVFLITVVLGGVAVWIGWRLQQEDDVTPEESEAASEEVIAADKLKTQAQRDAFAQLWREFAADETNKDSDYIEFALGDGARYECSTDIMTVGEESLYGCDLNAVFVLHEFLTYSSAGAISAQNSDLNAVLDELITHSGLLQKAAELDILKLDDTFYNNPEKNMLKRFSKVKKARNEIGDQFVKRVDFEAVVIYFHNQIDPEIPLEDAKTAAKTKMDVLYERIKSGEITMEEAGNEIMNDSIKGDTTGVSLSKLDRLYEYNAYSRITGHAFGDPIFTDSVYDEELRSLGEGQMSTVRLCHDFKFTDEEFLNAEDVSEFEWVESCYIVFKVIRIDLGLGADLESGTREELEESIEGDYKENTTLNIK